MTKQSTHKEQGNVHVATKDARIPKTNSVPHVAIFFSVCVKKLFVIVADGLCQRTTSFVKEFLSHVQSSL